MPRRLASTNSRGYTAEHRRIAAQLRAAFIPGTPCRKCGNPMWNLRYLDAGHPEHAPASSRGLPDALEHRHCNRSAGGRNGARSRWGTIPLGTSRQW